MRTFGMVRLWMLTALAMALPYGTTAAPLGDEDKQSLDNLIAHGVTDPTGKQSVRMLRTLRSVWGGSGQEVTVVGWLEPANGAEPAKVIFLDRGDWLRAPSKVERFDFIAECRKLAAEKKKPEDGDAAGGPGGNDAVFRRMSQVAGNAPTPLPLLVRAAWLHKLGEDDLAAALLTTARAQNPRDNEGKPQDLNEALRGQLAWQAFSAAVNAYMARADEEALRQAHRLTTLYPTFATKFGSGDGLLADLQRRQKAGTFNQPAPPMPKDLADWPAAKRVSWLIEQLDQVDARQEGQPGGVPLGADPRVAALIAVGDEAVAALIDCIESDTRLTRSVHFWRDFAQSRTLIGVHEAALTAVMSILRTRVFEPAATGDDFTSRGESSAKETARMLRRYWSMYGNLSFDQRMMVILSDQKARPEAWVEAAANLANYGEQRTLSTTVSTKRAKERPAGVTNPVISKFESPTVAEAILAAMDRHLDQFDRGQHDDLHDYRRRQIEEQYVAVLVQLQDRRVVPALLSRLEHTAMPRHRRLLAAACYELGEPGPLVLLANDVLTGRAVLPPSGKPQTNDGDQPDAVELRALIATLASAAVKVPAADAALWAISVPQHPFHNLAARHIQNARRGWSDDAVWLAHPFALATLRAELDNTLPTGTTYQIEHDNGVARLSERSANGSGSGPVPPELSDAAVRKDQATERECDRAAAQLSGLILGVPYCNPLLTDDEERIKMLKVFLDAHLEHLRHATYLEASTLDLFGHDVAYLLNVRRLSAGATVDDVTSGNALFHFDGKGTPLEEKLPMTAALKRDLPPAGANPTDADVDAGRAQRRWQPDAAGGAAKQVLSWNVPRVLILQAELRPDGKRVYGIVSRHQMQTVTEDEVADHRSLDK